MASILYLPSENELERRFRKLLGFAAPKKKIGICHTVRKPHSNVRLAVLFTLNRQEIMDILALGDLMADVKIILILPDDDRDTLMKAHTLRPKYVTCADCDPIDIVTVFKRMIDLYDVS
jgi:hypothetical protein